MRDMRRRIVVQAVILLLALGFLRAAGAAGAAAPKPVFDAITVNAAITPPIAQYILQSIEQAEKSGAAGLMIFLDTPGGLDLAMRDITKGILNASIPIFVYVYPAGARAASAGMFITEAAHVAAMTPGTNIGAAHPVGIGIGGGMDKTMTQKVENDAVAYIRGIAAKRGRNADWAEQAVRKSVSITAEDALRLKVIDLLAASPEDLLKQADGRVVQVAGRNITLKTEGAVINEKKMGTRQRILAILSDPNIAYILFLVGLAGLYFEFTNPGALLPGIMGGICLILAFFSMQTLPVNFAGVLLILFGIILFIAEIKIVSHGVLTIGGVISLVLGSLMLFDSPEPALRVSLEVMVPALAVVILFFVVVIALVVKAQLRKHRMGSEGMVGETGIVLSDIAPEGRVLVGGEYWHAVSDKPVPRGKKVRVLGVEGIKLRVEEI